MKKLLLLFVFILPLMSCSKAKFEYIDLNYNYNWEKFISDNRYTKGSNKRLWKYGYEKQNENYLPKKPPKFQIPDYLIGHPLLGEEKITLSTVKKKLYSNRDAVKFIKHNRGGYVSADGYRGLPDSILWGVTKDGVYFPTVNSEPSRPFAILVNSILVTVQNRCAIENRDPTLSEKFIVLFYACSDYNIVDNSYYSVNKDYINRSWFAEQVFGTMKIFIICFFFIFCMMIPAIAILLIKRFTPEGSIFHSAASFVEWLIILVGGATLVRAITKK